MTATLCVIDGSVQLERASDHEQRSWQVAERLGWAKTYDAEYVQTLTPAGLT
jgi:hypothetical protein